MNQSYFEYIINHFQDKLSLSEECTYLIFSYEDSIIWDDHIDCWQISHNPQLLIFLLIHELGHLNLSKLTDFEYFVKQRSSIKVHKGIYNILEGLTDSLVNINLCEDEEIYTSHYLEYINLLLNYPENIRTLRKYEKLMCYINFYLDLKYVLKEQEQIQLNERIRDFLSTIKNSLIIEFSSDRRFSQIIRNFEDYLDFFEEIKLNHDYKVILKCFYDFLEDFNIWDNEYLLDQFHRIYPEIDLSFLE